MNKIPRDKEGKFTSVDKAVNMSASEKARWKELSAIGTTMAAAANAAINKRYPMPKSPDTSKQDAAIAKLEKQIAADKAKLLKINNRISSIANSVSSTFGSSEKKTAAQIDAENRRHLGIKPKKRAKKK